MVRMEKSTRQPPRCNRPAHCGHFKLSDDFFRPVEEAVATGVRRCSSDSSSFWEHMNLHTPMTVAPLFFSAHV